LLNLIAGDGQTNVIHLKHARLRKWDETMKQEMAGNYGPGWSKLRKLRAKRDDNRAFQCDVLMANPRSRAT